MCDAAPSIRALTGGLGFMDAFNISFNLFRVRFSLLIPGGLVHNGFGLVIHQQLDYRLLGMVVPPLLESAVPSQVQQCLTPSTVTSLPNLGRS